MYTHTHAHTHTHTNLCLSSPVSSNTQAKAKEDFPTFADSVSNLTKIHRRVSKQLPVPHDLSLTHTHTHTHTHMLTCAWLSLTLVRGGREGGPSACSCQHQHDLHRQQKNTKHLFSSVHQGSSRFTLPSPPLPSPPLPSPPLPSPPLPSPPLPSPSLPSSSLPSPPHYSGVSTSSTTHQL